MSPRDPIHELGQLERYLDDYLRDENLTFEEWMERFGAGAYLARNQVISALLAPHLPKRIHEFACAGGFLAKLLLDGIGSIERYTCSNYSPRAVEYCRHQLSSHGNCDIKLLNADVLRSQDFRNEKLDDYDTFITTSFEHIEHDRELIQALPSGRLFVFCVAGFDDPEHFRVFSGAQQIRERYGHLLSIDCIETIGEQAQKYVTIGRTLG
jgi:SAM-dependent methyltransferase